MSDIGTCMKVESWMVKDVITITSNAGIREALTVMKKHSVRHLPVVEAGAVCGVVSIGDLVKCVASDQEMELRYLAAYIRGEYAV